MKPKYLLYINSILLFTYWMMSCNGESRWSILRNKKIKSFHSCMMKRLYNCVYWWSSVQSGWNGLSRAVRVSWRMEWCKAMKWCLLVDDMVCVFVCVHCKKKKGKIRVYFSGSVKVNGVLFHHCIYPFLFPTMPFIF